VLAEARNDEHAVSNEKTTLGSLPDNSDRLKAPLRQCAFIVLVILVIVVCFLEMIALPGAN
jgi:hypothetical protein